jgi:hypothetical protein
MEEYFEAVKKVRASCKSKPRRVARPARPTAYRDDAELSARQAVAFLGCTFSELRRLREIGAVFSVSDRRGGHRFVFASLKKIKNEQSPKAA